MKYKISLLDAHSNQQSPAIREAAMTDPSEWLGDISSESHSSLQDFNLISQEIAKVYGDKVRCHVAVIRLMQEFIHLPQQSVRAYANSWRPNWRQAGWNLQKNEEVHYNIGWAGLRNSRTNRVGPITPVCGRFDTLDEFFHMAVFSEVTHVKHSKPQQH